MKNLKNFLQLGFYLVLFSLTNLLHAQIKGKVIDENNQPIPYVNIGVQNEALGTTSEEDGTFFLPLKETKNIVFSALGYEKKTIASNLISIVVLKSTTYALNEVVVVNKKETKVLEIGGLKNSIQQAFENGPKIDAKFFPYQPEYKKTRYLKKVALYTENILETATVKIHFYEATSDGLPGNELLAKDFIITLKKGTKKSWFDVSVLNIEFPKSGLFVAVERLLIDKNKHEKQVLDSKTNTYKTKVTYYPLLFYNYLQKDYSYSFYGGSWHKESTLINPNYEARKRIFEPAIQLILTN
jgi:CarboxypepD_reg-like domain